MNTTMGTVARIPQIDNSTSFLYLGMDLHLDNIVVCARQTVMDRTGHLVGRTVYRKKFKILGRENISHFSEAMAKLLDDVPHMAVVESTYNWYWLADLFDQHGWRLRIIDPSTVSTNQVKYSDDYTDAEYLAERLRQGSAKLTTIIPREDRAVRDLVRFRMSKIQERAGKKIMLINFYANHLSQRIKTRDLEKMIEERVEQNLPLDESMLAEHFDLLEVRIKAAMLYEDINHLTRQIDMLDRQLQQIVCSNPIANVLRTIKGCGPVLARIISLEIHDMNRFAKAGNFASYCRLAPTAKLSNGRSKGEGNAKNGNAYLSWAMTELATFVCRYNPEAQRCYDRLFAKHRLRVKAIRAIAAKLCRAIYMMVKHGTVFDVKRCFGG